MIVVVTFDIGVQLLYNKVNKYWAAELDDGKLDFFTERIERCSFWLSSYIEISNEGLSEL